MRWRRMAVEGAIAFIADQYPDHRGVVVSHPVAETFGMALDRPLFPVGQVCWSRNRKAVLRGLHYTLTAGCTAKYVYCTNGTVVDFLVDSRVGSPTFGRIDAVHLSEPDAAFLYLPTGVAHGYLTLSEGAVVNYLLAAPYAPETEYALAALDPELGLPLAGTAPVLSERDAAARTLAEAARRGLLPDHEACVAADRRAVAHVAGGRADGGGTA